MYVPRSGSRSTGCVRPFESVARAISVCFPDFAGVFQSNSQSRHAFGLASPMSFASFHVDPPSTLSLTLSERFRLVLAWRFRLSLAFPKAESVRQCLLAFSKRRNQASDNNR